MTSEHTSSDQIIEQYLGDLREALRIVNPLSSNEFVAEIEQHIIEGRASLESGDEVGLRNLLERIGSPTALANELKETEPPRTVSAMDRATPWLILFGGFAFGFGWLVGLYGLWSSKTWRIWDKLLGTFFWPGGLLGTFYLFLAPAGVLPRGLQFLAGFVAVAAPIFTCVRLGTVLSRGYADVSNPRGMRVVSSGRSRTTTRIVWIIEGVMIVSFAIFVMTLH